MKTYDSAMRRRVLLAAMTLAAIVTLIFGIDAFRAGLVELGAVDLSICLISLGLLLVARRRPHSVAPNWIFVTIMSSFFVYLYASGGHGGTGLLFLLLIPLATPLFLGWRHGIAVSLATLLVCVGFLLRGTTSSPLPGVAEDATLARVGAIYIVSLVLSSLYDLGMQRAYRDETRAKEELRETEERYRSLFDSSLECVYVHDFEGRFLDANDAALKLLGYDREEITGLNFASLISEEQLPTALASLQEVVETGAQAHESEYRIRCRDGSFVEVNTTASLVYHDGEPYAIQGVARDITARKRAEEELRESESRHRFLAENMGDIIWLLDMDLNTVYVSPSITRILGFTPEERREQSLDEMLTPESLRNVSEAFERELARETEHSDDPDRVMYMEVEYYHKDGSTVWMENRIRALRDTDGRLTGLYGVSRDIRERREAEEALRRSEERYRTILEETGDGYFESDLAGNFTFVNDAQCRLLGYPREELIGMNYRALVSLEKAQELRDAYSQMYRTGEPVRDLLSEVVRRDGSTGYAETSAFPIRNEKGDIVGFRGVRRDITERREAEQALRESEERYRTLFDNTANPILVIDTEGNYLDANEAGLVFLECTRKELITKNVRDYGDFGPDEQLLNRHIRLWAEGGRIDVEHHVNGRVKVLDLTMTPGTRQGQAVVIGVGTDITERKAAEDALELQKAYFQQLFESSPDAIFMVDTEDRIVQVNRGCETLFGYSLQETGGSFPNELIVPEDRREEAAVLSRAVLDGGVVREETVRRRRDGSLVDVSVTGYPIHYDNGVVGAYIIYSDITERRQSLEALNDQRAYFQQLFDSSPDAVVMLGADDRVVRSNRGFEALFGYGEEETAGRLIGDLVIPEGYEDEALSATQVVLDGGVVRKEAVRKRKDGSLVDVAVLGYPIVLDDRTVGMYVTYTDIGDRRKMEKALEQAAEDWRRTFDSIGDPVSIHDRDYVLRRVNMAFAQAFGAEPRSMIGRPCYEVMHGTDAPPPGCPHKATLQTGAAGAAEFTEPGLGVCREITTSPIFDDGGEIAGSVHIARDITERRRQEEHLMMADRLACVGELAAGTAHELNNPLTSVIGFSRLLLEKDVPDDVQEDLEIVCSEAQRAADVVKQLLKLAHRQLPVRNPNQVNDIISDVLKLRAYEQKVNNIEVRRKLARSLPEVMVDYFQMQQVLLNIIINAEHAVRQVDDGGTVTVSTQRRNNTVVISVADNGPGIPGEHMNELFKPFFTTKRSGEGTGLGLSICHRIITDHGGRIYAKSRSGQGATFVVELPLNGA